MSGSAWHAVSRKAAGITELQPAFCAHNNCVQLFISCVAWLDRTCCCCFCLCCFLSNLQLVHQGLCKAGLLQGDAGSSSSSIQSMDSALTTLPTNGTSPSSSSDISSNGRDQHQQQLALPIHVESGPAWDVADPACPAWTACWSAICGVWASKWNHRCAAVSMCYHVCCRAHTVAVCILTPPRGRGSVSGGLAVVP